MKSAPKICAAVLALATAASAEEVTICFNYGCSEQALVRYSPSELGQVQAQFVAADSPATEREAVARAVAWLYFYAGMQSPIWRDRGENFEDDGSGRMDCIDHSTNTMVFLRLLARHGWLRFHTVGERVMRGLGIDDHWAARVVERDSKDEWVVDTWFFDPGLPAAVFPRKAWQGGASPPVHRRPRAAL
jgi:hypothetical protein